MDEGFRVSPGARFTRKAQSLILHPRAHEKNPMLSTDGTLIRAEAGPKVLASPPTAQMAQAFLSLTVAIYTLGEYNWRHRGDF